MIDSINPTGILSKYIKNYFIVEIDNPIDFLPNERVYPCGYATIVFHYGSPSKFQKKNSSKYIEPNLVNAVNKPIIMICPYLERQV